MTRRPLSSTSTRVPSGFFSASLINASISSGVAPELTVSSRPVSVTPILTSTPDPLSSPCTHPAPQVPGWSFVFRLVQAGDRPAPAQPRAKRRNPAIGSRIIGAGSEQPLLGVVVATQGVVVQYHATQAAVQRQRSGLRPDLLGGEYPRDRRQQRIPAEQLDVAGELFDTVDLPAALDLDRNDPTLRVPAQQVDRTDRRRMLATYQGPSRTEHVDLLGQERLQMGLHPVLDQPRIGAEFVGRVVQYLGDGDDQLLAGAVADQPSIPVDSQPARRRHPVQRLVGTVVGVDRDRSIGLDQQEPVGHGQVGGQPPDVVHRTPGDNQTHPVTLRTFPDGPVLTRPGPHAAPGQSVNTGLRLPRNAALPSRAPAVCDAAAIAGTAI